jgi:hypothetical protein
MSGGLRQIQRVIMNHLRRVVADRGQVHKIFCQPCVNSMRLFNRARLLLFTGARL